MYQDQKKMKRQVISHYNQSKQVLNDFFNNSDDDDEEAEEDKDIQTMNDQIIIDDSEQYQNEDNHHHRHQVLPLSAFNSNSNIINQQLNNQNGSQSKNLNQFDISLQNIQQISKAPICSLINQDLLVPSCNYSIVSLQNHPEEYPQVPPPIQLNKLENQQIQQDFSQGRFNNPQQQSEGKNLYEENIKVEENKDSDCEGEQQNQDGDQRDIENSDEDEQSYQYYKDNNNNCQQYNNIGSSSKQQNLQSNAMKYIDGRQDSLFKGDIIKLPTSYNNTDDLRGKSEGIKQSQSVATSNLQKKILIRQTESQRHNNNISAGPKKNYPQQFSILHKNIMRKEISVNFLVMGLFGIYLIFKSIFFNDSSGNSCQIPLFWIAGMLIFLGILGLLFIFVGLRSNREFQSSSNSINTKIIMSSGEKGALTDYSQRLQNNNTNNLNNRINGSSQFKQKLQMKISNQNQPTQLSSSPQKVTQSPLRLLPTENKNMKQQIKDQQNKDNNNIQFLKQDQNLQINSSSPASKNSSPVSSLFIFLDERRIMNAVILIYFLSFILLVESIKLITDIKSIILIFFIYHQFIIFYKLSATHFSSKFTLSISFLLISYAIIRSKLFFYFNENGSNNDDSNNNKTNSNYLSSQFFFENTILDCIIAFSLLFQMSTMRFLAISPFLFNLYGNYTLAQEKIMMNAGISSICNLGYIENDIENETKPSQFMKRMLINRVKNKNLQMSKEKTQNHNNGEDTLMLNENTPLSPEIERQKSNHIKKMYQDILNLIPEGVALINSQNKLVYANKTLSKILQCSKNQIIKILLNLATKSKGEYDTTSQRVLNNLNSPQTSKVNSLNQLMPHPRATSQSIYKSFNSLLNNNNNNINMSSQNQMTQQLNNNGNNNNSSNNNNNANNFQNICPLDINNINPNKINSNNNIIGNTSNTNSQQNFPNRKASAEIFDVKRKTSSTAKPSIFNRNHKTSFSKDESPFYNMNSMGNNVTTNIPYNQLSHSNTRNLSTNGATPINLNFNTYQGGGGGGGSENHKQSMQFTQSFKTSPFEPQMVNPQANLPLDDLLDKNAPLSQQNSNRQGMNHQQYTSSQNKQQTYEYSDAVSLTHYIQCPMGTCLINCIHNQALYRENAPDASSFNDQFRNGINNMMMNASANPNQEQGGENLVRKQRSKKFKKSEIIRKDISVRDILSSIFENLKQTQQDQDTKTAKTFQLKKKNSDITSHNTYIGPQPTRKTSPSRQYSRQGSFLSQMKNNQQYIGYFQYVDDMIKVEVEYNNSTLVLSMVMCEIVINGFVEQLAMVLVDPLWQEMYDKKLEDMSKYRMKMFASLSHELRTPLNCSISMLQQVKGIMKEDCQGEQNRQDGTVSIKERIRNKLQYKDNSQLKPNQLSVNVIKEEENSMFAKLIDKMQDYIQTYIDPALNSNKLLLNLINDILDFVQIDSGKFKFSFIKFDLEQLLASCVSLVGIQGKQNDRDVELVLKYDERCPKIINSDPNRIRQVVLNFLSNAMKFTSQGQIVVSATLVNYKDKVNGEQSQDMSSSQQLFDEEIMNNSNHIVEIAVEDQGIGISPEDIDKIFTIFNKIDLGENQTLNSQGCGLGLTISNSNLFHLTLYNFYKVYSFLFSINQVCNHQNSLQFLSLFSSTLSIECIS